MEKFYFKHNALLENRLLKKILIKKIIKMTGYYTEGMYFNFYYNGQQI